jgi:hypothetical protein
MRRIEGLNERGDAVWIGRSVDHVAPQLMQNDRIEPTRDTMRMESHRGQRLPMTTSSLRQAEGLVPLGRGGRPGRHCGRPC